MTGLDETHVCKVRDIRLQEDQVSTALIGVLKTFMRILHYVYALFIGWKAVKCMIFL